MCVLWGWGGGGHFRLCHKSVVYGVMRRGSPYETRRSSSMTIEMGDVEGGTSPLLRTPDDNNSSPSSGGALDVSLRDYSSSSKRYKGGVSYAYLTRHSTDALRMYALVLLVATCVACPFLEIEWCILTLVFSSCAFGTIASLWLSRTVLQCDDGTAEMREVSNPIREGAEGFLKVQYTAIAKFAIPLAILIVVSNQFRPNNSLKEPAEGVALLGNAVLGVVAALGFCFGAVCSAISGYVSMWVATLSNIRVASAARRTYGEALVLCFRGGAFSAVLNLTLCITGTCGTPHYGVFGLCDVLLPLYTHRCLHKASHSCSLYCTLCLHGTILLCCRRLTFPCSWLDTASERPL